MERRYGSRYEETKGLRTVEIAALIRKHVKAELKREGGVFPKGATVSVRSSSYSGGTSIDIEITAWPTSTVDQERLALAVDHAQSKSIAEGKPLTDLAVRDAFLVGRLPLSFEASERMGYSPEVARALGWLRDLHASFNYDGSDCQVDHFDVRFGGHPRIAWEIHDTDLLVGIASSVKARTAPPAPTVPSVVRCAYRVGLGPRCCREDGHDGPHHFKCAGSLCPGLPWPASVLQHPIQCIAHMEILGHAFENEREPLPVESTCDELRKFADDAIAAPTSSRVARATAIRPDIKVDRDHGGDVCARPSTRRIKFGGLYVSAASSDPGKISTLSMIEMCSGCGCVRFLLVPENGGGVPVWSKWIKIEAEEV